MIRLAPILMAGVSLASAPSSRPLDEVADLYGARLGMSRAAVQALMHGKCSIEGGDPHQIFITCGARHLSAGFTSAGKVWWITASHDLTGTKLSLAAARRALTVRYGKPAVVNERQLVWLPSGSTADPAKCSAEATMATAEAELYKNGSQLPTVSPGCVPLRSAILAAMTGHDGVIVQESDPRARIAELAH